MKETFKNLDLRKQLTEELKDTWYYKQVKWGLKINKHSVKFDDSFEFVCEFQPEIIEQETRDVVLEKDIVLDGIIEARKGDIIHFEKGEVISEATISVVMYSDSFYQRTLMACDNSKYSDDITDILENILLYIANHI